MADGGEEVAALATQRFKSPTQGTGWVGESRQAQYHPSLPHLFFDAGAAANVPQHTFLVSEIFRSCFDSAMMDDLREQNKPCTHPGPQLVNVRQLTEDAMMSLYTGFLRLTKNFQNYVFRLFLK